LLSFIFFFFVGWKSGSSSLSIVLHTNSTHNYQVTSHSYYD
jgi:hypothetical protein